jgi:hypothetical protein
MKSISFKDKFEKQVAESINSNEEVRDAVNNVVSERFGGKESFDERFDRILNEIRIAREKSDERWEKNDKRWEKNDRKWDENQQKLVENDRKWDENQRVLVENDRKWDENQKKLVENDRKWEETQKTLVENDRKWEENQKKLVENDRKWDEIGKDREENARKWAENTKEWAENNRKWDENQKVIERTLDEISAIKTDVKALGAKYVQTIGALGTRWGLYSERSFRNALKGILEETTEYKVERVIEKDESGVVFGHPSQIELDIVVKNGKFFIVEIKSSVSAGDVATFVRKARIYEKSRNRKAGALVIISPMVSPNAKKVIKRDGIILYSYATDVSPAILE